MYIICNEKRGEEICQVDLEIVQMDISEKEMEPDLVVLRVVGWGGLARCIHVMSTGLPYLQPCSCLWKMVSPGPLITDHHIKVDFFDSSFQKKSRFV
jgi:hypothetical protein